MYYTYIELCELLQFNDEHESFILIPNEIFEELKKNIEGAGSSHIAFAYSYYYLVNWLYRYTKYGNNKERLEQKMLKKILGYSPTNKTIDYIIKKNGVLEKMNYLQTTKDIPLWWEFTNGDNINAWIKGIESEDLTFHMLSDFTYEEMAILHERYPKNFKIKLPLKSFYRDYNEIEDNEELILNGTYYEFDRTHLIPFEVFLYCVSNKKIGVTGFYLYSYLKNKNQIYKSGYDISLEDLTIETGIKSSTLDKYLDILKKYNLIKCIHNQEYFVVGLKEEDRMANTYITNDFDFFSNKPNSYKKINVITRYEYKKILEKEKEKEQWNEVGNDIALEELPY